MHKYAFSNPIFTGELKSTDRTIETTNKKRRAKVCNKKPTDSCSSKHVVRMLRSSRRSTQTTRMKKNKYFAFFINRNNE